MARGARGENAIHHIYAEAGVFDDFLGSADAHQVARFVGGKMLERRLDYLAGQLPGLSDAEAADGVAGKIDCDGSFGGFSSQQAIHAALNYAEEGLRPAPTSRGSQAGLSGRT